MAETDAWQDDDFDVWMDSDDDVWMSEEPTGVSVSQGRRKGLLLGVY